MSVSLSTGGDLLEPPHQRPVLLDAYAARTCPVKTHNAFDPTVTIPPVESGARLTELFDGASEFEAVVLEELITSCRGRVVDLRLLAEPSRGPSGPRPVARRMASGAAVIIAGLLPVDRPGHRVGRPDLLVRGADAPDRPPGLSPCRRRSGTRSSSARWPRYRRPDVRWRAGRLDPLTEQDEPAVVWLHHPGGPAPRRRPGPAGPPPSVCAKSRAADFLQLAHYHRMLQALWLCGRAGPRAQ